MDAQATFKSLMRELWLLLSWFKGQELPQLMLGGNNYP